MQVGVLGLGKMGKQISQKLMDGGHQVVIWNRSTQVVDAFRAEKPENIVQQKLLIAHTLEELHQTLVHPRVIWSMLPAGEPTEEIMKSLSTVVEAGDLVIDGGNAYYKDTQRRYEEFKAKQIRFLGIGVSGGIHGFTNGFPLMVGGDQEAYTYAKPLLDTLSQPRGGHMYLGEGGAGHFVKMAHNGIEYGMMQAIAEGFGVLAKGPYNINLVDAGTIYQKGSIVSSFLVQMALNAFVKDPMLSQIDGYIAATGEGKWTIEQARVEKVPVPVIEQSLEFRNKSQYDPMIQATLVAKLVAAMRQEFGGHSAKKPETPETKI